MPWTRALLKDKLAELEAKVPSYMHDRNTFFRNFEDEVEIILGEVDDADADYAQRELEAIIERSGINH